ncbi:MAG: peptide chain release factor N(5)-glutamine methyltransferase [Clostridia bacterium]|nr:peptide chain release factor N(5)-glutamine methyltransferase [Clostridia bacterium]
MVTEADRDSDLLKSAEDAILASAAILRTAADPSPRMTAIRLAAFVTGLREQDFLVGKCPLLTRPQAERLLEAARARARGVPLQYILEEAWFMGHPFFVGPGVMVPRPDTETLVSEGLVRVASLGVSGSSGIRFIDACTGSGCVGLSLAASLDRTGVPYEGWLTDSSEDALRYAYENLRRITPHGTLRIAKCDLFPESCGDCSLILSNPPYIPAGDIPGLMPEVSVYEPKAALDGGPDGLSVLRRVIGGARERLLPGGWLLVEHGYDQGGAVRSLFQDSFGFDTVETVRDYGGNERVTAGRVPAGGTVH